MRRIVFKLLISQLSHNSGTIKKRKIILLFRKGLPKLTKTSLASITHDDCTIQRPVGRAVLRSFLSGEV